jgi:acyl-CoA synthetase (AMP-forming)/AMP-acid ligase II
VSGDDTLDYGGLDAAAGRLATRIGKLPGLRVVVIAPNVPALVVAMLAGWRAGAVVVPVSARLREQELGRIVADAEPTVVISVREHLGYAFAELAATLLPQLATVRAWLVVDPGGEVEEELPGRAEETAEPLDEGVAAILYTSGTTGEQKGALVGHVREVNGARELANALELTAEDAAVFVVPVSHAFGLTTLLATLATGGVAVLVDSSFSLEPMLRAVEGRGATVLHGSPSLFLSMRKARPAGVATVRTGFVAGARSPDGLIEQLDRTGTRILNLYGLTEAGAVAACRAGDEPEVRYTTCGRILPPLEARVEDGELQLRGEHVTPGYHRRPERSEETFVDGWLRTGDLASIDERGHLRIVGRAKDIVHVGGFNVVPAEVEGVLASHPDVLDAAVIGVEHERMGEVLQAFVVVRPGAELTPAALLRFARPRIAGYKLPYAIRILPKLPLLSSGKPDRAALTRVAS